MKKLKSSRLSYKLSRYLPLVSTFNNTSKYEADVELSVVSLISSLLGYIKSTYEWNLLLLIDKTSSIYRNVALRATGRDFFSLILPRMNTETGPLTNGHNSYPWEFQLNRLLEDLSSNNYMNIVYKEFQHLFNFNFGVLVHGIRVIFNKVMFLVTDHKI
jgi:hypothetical protein